MNSDRGPDVLQGQKERFRDQTSQDVLTNAKAGRQYWEKASADGNGMLGDVPLWEGFEAISSIDLQGSRTFLASLGIGLEAGRKPLVSVLEGGAGIGRITKGLLLDIAEHVDVIEPVRKFVRELEGSSGVRTIYHMGLEEWTPAEGATYDLVWTQWCVGHLSDEQLVEYLRLCRTVLEPEKGVIVIKENISTTGRNEFDDEDKAVTRLDDTFRSIFEEAGLKVAKSELQHGMPETPTRRLLPVMMYALRP